MDFTADGRYAVATCEFSGQLLKLDVTTHKVIAYLTLNAMTRNQNSMPQDIRLSPDGQIFYVADMKMNGVFLIDAATFRVIGFIPTGIGTHGVYPSRNGKLLYIINRGCSSMICHPGGPGSISVIDPRIQKIVATWVIPGGGSPDMGNITADGTELWLSGRYDREVYVFNTTTGLLVHRIPVGRGPHGLTVWPQPGRYSLGHTGNMR
jgi:DNA-binding beta-propeller fold protein YncE